MYLIDIAKQKQKAFSFKKFAPSMTLFGVWKLFKKLSHSVRFHVNFKQSCIQMIPSWNTLNMVNNILRKFGLVH